jgi:predicted metal-binding membrane protein
VTATPTRTGGLRVSTPRATLLVGLVLGVAALAWVAMVWFHASTGEPGGHHVHDHGAAASPASTAFLSLVGGWLVMVVAMMLPTALPFLRMLAGLVRRRPWPHVLLTAGVGAYIAVWAGVGAVLVGASAGIARVAWAAPWLRDRPQVLAVGALLLAGAYQFSPLKNACLRACRSPRSFAFAHWRGIRPPAVESSRMGAAYGLSCVGCCWALMALGVLAGAAGLMTMAVLTLVMVGERLGHRGLRLVRPVGVLLLALAVLVGTGALPAVPFV